MEEFRSLPVEFEPRISSALLSKIKAGELVKIAGTVRNAWKVKVAVLTDNITQAKVTFVSNDITVAAIEQFVKDALGKPRAKVQLCFRSLELVKDDLLAEYCAPPYTKLIAICNSKLRSIRLSQLSYITPWRVLTPGLNYEAHCLNSNCSAYEQIVYCPRGRGLFHLEAEQFLSYVCPVCKEDVKLVSFGVAYCQYTYSLYVDCVASKSLSGAEKSFCYVRLELFAVLKLNSADLETRKLRKDIRSKN
jgi:hypothetical protein